MRLLLLAGSALLLTACDGERSVSISSSDDNGSRSKLVTKVSDRDELRPISRLNCPEKEGDLRLTSTGADGRSCFYRTRNGAEAELRLVPLDGRGYEAVLQPLQDELTPLVPGAARPAEPPQPPLAPGPNSGDKTRVSIAGVVDIRTEGENATIKAPGVSIEAKGDNAEINVDEKDGQDVSIQAHDGGATIRAESGKGGDVRSTFVLASERAGASGLRLAGYSARGPKAGPIVIGVVKARNDDDRDVFDDVEDLVKRNAGD